MTLISRRLDVYRTHLAATRQEEINLIVVLAALGWPCVVKKLIACRLQHLRHNILIYVTQVCRQLVAKQFLIDDILCNVLIPESQGDEESCVVDKGHNLPKIS